MKAALVQFDRQLRQVAGPALGAAGFTGEPLRCWRREVRHEGTRSIQIIEFEVGTRDRAGLFTVNLGIYNASLAPPDWPAPTGAPHPHHCLPDMTERLGWLQHPHPNWMDRLLRRPARPHDPWWKQMESEYAMRQCLTGVIRDLDEHGLTWLDSRTSVLALRSARDALPGGVMSRSLDSTLPG